MDDIFFSPEQEAMDDELGAAMGDPRRCPHHQHVETSSPDGMFDCPCGECEYEMEQYGREPEPQCMDLENDPRTAWESPEPEIPAIDTDSFCDDGIPF